MAGGNLDLEQFLIKGEQRIPNLYGAKFNNADLYEYQRCVRVSGGKFDIPFEMIPQAWCDGATAVTGRFQNADELIVCEASRLFESIHALVCICVDVIVYEEGPQVVLIHDLFGDLLDVEPEILPAFHR